jgi:hypothetical protein
MKYDELVIEINASMYMITDLKNNKGEQSCAMEALQTWLARIEGIHDNDDVNMYSKVLEGEVVVESKFMLTTFIVNERLQ